MLDEEWLNNALKSRGIHPDSVVGAPGIFGNVIYVDYRSGDKIRTVTIPFPNEHRLEYNMAKDKF